LTFQQSVLYNYLYDPTKLFLNLTCKLLDILAKLFFPCRFKIRKYRYVAHFQTSHEEDEKARRISSRFENTKLHRLGNHHPIVARTRRLEGGQLSPVRKGMGVAWKDRRDN